MAIFGALVVAVHVKLEEEVEINGLSMGHPTLIGRDALEHETKM
jgi:hypothetical protein